MKDKKWYLPVSILNFLVFACFAFAAAAQKMFPAKLLYGVAACCLLVSSVGLAYSYSKAKKELDVPANASGNED